VSEGSAAPETAGLARRFLALVYETLLVTAVAFAGMVPFVVITSGLDPAVRHPLNQLYLVCLLGLYFVWQWTHGGQTLAMKTWRLKLVTRQGGSIGMGVALRRYALALAGVLALGAGFLWAFVDRERQFLHDRLSGTQIIVVPATTPASPPR
jgi:uncharacterized RDD family membrane protein YckC